MTKKDYARIRNVETGEIIKVYPRTALYLPAGIFEALDTITNCSVYGVGKEKVKVVKK